jgi:hypothetical protein
VEVRCNEGVAIRIGPEPCAGVREGVGEASAGERIGQPLSRENLIVLGADVFERTEGYTGEGATRVFVRPGVVGEPGMCGSSLRGNREVSGSACGRTPQVRIGKMRSRSR